MWSINDKRVGEPVTVDNKHALIVGEHFIPSFSSRHAGLFRLQHCASFVLCPSSNFFSKTPTLNFIYRPHYLLLRYISNSTLTAARSLSPPAYSTLSSHSGIAKCTVFSKLSHVSTEIRLSSVLSDARYCQSSTEEINKGTFNWPKLVEGAYTTLRCAECEVGCWYIRML